MASSPSSSPASASSYDELTLAVRQQQQSDMRRERNRASFSVEALSELLAGGPEERTLRHKVWSVIEANSALQCWDKAARSREERFRAMLRKQLLMLQVSALNNLSAREHKLLSHYCNELWGLNLHHVMFIPAIRNGGDERQREHWLPLAYSYRVLGCYAQTELAHGSNVRRLATTATYLPETQQFELHTPHIGALKWWPGGLGLLSTHCVTQAQTFVRGKYCGVQTFIVQLRSLDTYEHLPGVTTGDIGPKLGYDTVDNGFLRLDHVRIPRENMLMRFARVFEEGEFTSPPNDKLSYATMLGVRAGIVAESSQELSRAVTIAVRYSAVRRQFNEEQVQLNTSPPAPDQLELQVLDYQTQQHRLFGMLATAFAFHFTGLEMTRLHRQLLRDIEHGKFDGLAETHAVSSGLKALTTGTTADGIEDCRKACGGHGYSAASGIHQLFIDYVPACTYEGDNIILFQQTARYLVKRYFKIASGKKDALGESVKYLADKFQGPAVKSPADLSNTDALLRAFELRSRSMIAAVATAIRQAQSKGSQSENQVWNCEMHRLVNCSKAHSQTFIVRGFVESLQNLEEPYASLRPVLSRLMRLYALQLIESNLGEFLISNAVTEQAAATLHSQIANLLAEVRPDAVALVDSFEHPDFYLVSSLGLSSGDVYQHMFDWAKRGRLNNMPPQEWGLEYVRALLDGKLHQQHLRPHL